jgi:hypothetical protein
VAILTRSHRQALLLREHIAVQLVVPEEAVEDVVVNTLDLRQREHADAVRRALHAVA